MTTTADRARAGLRGLRNSWRSWARRHSVDPVVGSVRWGDFGATTPTSESFGFDRGLPVDRFFLETWLTEHHSDIQGRVLEVAEDLYATHYGGSAVRQVDLLFAPGFEEDAPAKAICADLCTLQGVEDKAYDCLIITQTLQFCPEPFLAAQSLARVLKPSGVCLATFAGIAPISSYDEERWGEYWRITEQGAHALFDPAFGATQVEVVSYGNVAAACAFLQGLCSEDLSPEQLQSHDPRYPILVCLRAVKPKETEDLRESPAL